MIGRRPSTAWGVLLAGGDGTRLQSLTTRIEGDTRPKQFCRMLGDETLVTQTRRRISPLFDSDKMITIVTKQHKEFYSRELDDWPQTRAVVQPANRGTGVALAAAILMLRELVSVAAKKCASLAGRKRRWSGYGLATGRRRVPVVTQDGLSSEGLTCGAR